MSVVALKTKTLTEEVSYINEIRVQLKDMNSSVEDYIIRDPTSNVRYNKLNNKINQYKPKNVDIETLMEYGEYLFNLLKGYTEYINLLLSERYLNIITLDTSETYSQAYVKKCEMLKNKIKEAEKKVTDTLLQSIEDDSNLVTFNTQLDSLSKNKITFSKLLPILVKKNRKTCRCYSICR